MQLSFFLQVHLTDRDPRERKAWSSREKGAVAKHLGGYLHSRTVPGKAAIMVLFKAEPTTFANRSWRNVEDLISRSSLESLQQRSDEKQPHWPLLGRHS